MTFPLHLREKIKLPAALIAGITCLLFARVGILVIFFLVPLGFVCFRHNGETSWAAFAFASGLDLIFGLLGMAVLKTPGAVMASNFVFFIAMTAAFTWINAPRLIIIPGVWRIIAGSVLMALVFLGIFHQRLGNELFYETIRNHIGELSSLYKSASSDVGQKALLDSLSPELLIEAAKALMLRGGALVSAIFMFWMSRQASITLTRFTKAPYQKSIAYRPRFLKNFYADSKLIWVLSVTLVLILLLRFFSSRNQEGTPLEILLWNILVLCVILYFAQGLGILQHFTSRLAVPPFLRLLLSVIFVLLLFSPGINVVFLGLVILLGIAENWFSFRQPKPWGNGKNGPPSTPEAGDDTSSRV